jgi:Ca2+-binding RTX toxin-like protein
MSKAGFIPPLAGRGLLDHDSDNSFSPAFFLFDTPSWSFNAPTIVFYSSDLNLPPAHTPEVVMAAGAGGGHPGGGGGTTTAPSPTLVNNGSGTGLAINLVWDSSVTSAPSAFTAGVVNVAQYFVSHFSDNVTLNITVGYGEAGGHALNGALGMSLSYLQSSSYSQIQNALTGDQSSTADAAAVASLTSDPTSGGGNYWVTTAEAKSLGLLTSTTNTDGSVGFSSSSGIFDYNNSDGVTAGQYDFFAVVAHEFSEVMGRILLVGTNVGGTANSYDILDLFHYSAPATHDLSGSLAGYFSVDNGTTDLHDFNTIVGGDAGDWATSTSPDAFDAYGSPGKVEPISASDLMVLDAIGWNVASPGPPQPLPDLTVSDLTLDSSGTNVSFSLHNVGSADASFDSSKVAASLYLSTDSTITTTDTKLGDVVESLPLAFGGSLPLSLSFSGMSAPATAGTYYLGVIADPTGAIPEASESNNVSNVVPVILGTTGANTLTGTAGKDVIIGFDGNDTITGSGGGDTLIGGTGADHFRYTAQTQGLDTIVDFSHGEDALDFSRLAFGSHLATNGANTGTLDVSHFTVNQTGSATGATAQFVYNTDNHILSFDADGAGGTGAVQIVVLGNAAPLTNTDIHLV